MKPARGNHEALVQTHGLRIDAIMRGLDIPKLSFHIDMGKDQAVFDLHGA